MAIEMVLVTPAESMFHLPQSLIVAKLMYDGHNCEMITIVRVDFPRYFPLAKFSGTLMVSHGKCA